MAGFPAAGIAGSSSNLEPEDLSFQNVLTEEHKLIQCSLHFRQQWGKCAEDGLDSTPPSFSQSSVSGKTVATSSADWASVASSWRPTDNSESRRHKTEPFSLAFSGGGVRAAAFQAGVLWRLAQEGLLKEVDYLAAVSGGAYIAAAFASHLHSAKPPGRDSNLDSWYLSTVARVVCRMQRNAGDFVRDPGNDSWLKSPEDGSGLLPRVFDVPQLILTLCLSLVMKPLQMALVVVVPFVEVIQYFFGAGMRASFCSPGVKSWDVMIELSPLLTVLQLIEVLAVFNLLISLCSRLPGLRSREAGKVDLGKPNRRRFLYINGLKCFVRRVLAGLVFIMISVVAIPEMQVVAWSHPGHSSSRLAYCEAYVTAYKESPLCEDLAVDSIVWYDVVVKNLNNTGVMPATASSANVTTITAARHSKFKWKKSMINSFLVWTQDHRPSFNEYLIAATSVVFLISCVVVPCRPSLLLSVLTASGPLLYLSVVLLFLQRRVYDPITRVSDDSDPSRMNEEWDAFMFHMFYIGVGLAYFYNQWTKLWHCYYVRTLQVCFFDKGGDMSLVDLRDCFACPLLILTGTVVDYKPLEEAENIAEISFSTLHTGSLTTGFVRTPQYRSLAKAMALSGAGCLDAITLSMSHRLRFRIWLEMLNLCWGDYILFPHRVYERRIQRLARRVGHHLEAPVTWTLYQLPNIILFTAFFMIFGAGWHFSRVRDCDTSRTLVLLAVGLVALVAALSFFAFARYLFFMSLCPVIRQMHQLTQYFFRDFPAPGMLYVTDGGVRDCTGIIQLMLRRRRRILLVLAAADPNDELGVLRSTMAVAVQQGLASFFDPDMHRRDVNLLLNEFGQDKSRQYLRVGIHYISDKFGLPRKYSFKDANACSVGEDGELLIVKNRLPPNWEDVPVQPLLTEAEMCAASGPVDIEPDVHTVAGGSKGMRYSELGGLGCCDGCHKCGCNCFGKFPHLTGANYLWLTPTLFGGLCRLGHHLSGGVVRQLREPPLRPVSESLI